MPLQSYDEIQSLFSGDVPAVVYKQAADEATEFASLLADLQKIAPALGSDQAIVQKIVSRVDQYLNPPLSASDFVINEDKSLVKFAWSTGRFNNNFPIPLTAGQQVDASIATQASGNFRGDFECAALLLTATGRVSMQIKAANTRRKLSSTPLSANLWFGNAQIPGLLASTFLAQATTTWNATIKDLSGSNNSVSPVFFGRRVVDSDQARVDAVRRALLFSQFMSPYLLGPLSGVVTVAGAGSLGGIAGGAEVTLLAGQTATLRYDTGGSYFLLYWLLDDSTQSDAAEPNLSCQIFMGDVSTPLMDTPISARDFVFAPTVSVTGMKQLAGLNGLNAAQCQSPGGGWTMLIPPGTKIQVQFTNNNSIASGKTITLRNALGGVALYSPTDLDNLLKCQVGGAQAGAA